MHHRQIISPLMDMDNGHETLGMAKLGHNLRRPAVCQCTLPGAIPKSFLLLTGYDADAGNRHQKFMPGRGKRRVEMR